MSECLPWQRARSDEQIEQREAAILKAAATLFENHPYSEITFAMIGKKACFTRSNLYRYFKTKEEVFLKLLELDFRDWRDRILPVVQSEAMTRKSFVSLWLPELMAAPRLLRLYDILANVLEENASDEAVRSFKQAMAHLFQDLNQALLAKKLFANDEGLMKFLTSQIALASGMYPKLNMPERLHRLSAEQGMNFPREFYETLLHDASQSLYQTFSV